MSKCYDRAIAKKEAILEYFDDIDEAYDYQGKHRALSSMLDELIDIIEDANEEGYFQGLDDGFEAGEDHAIKNEKIYTI